jgi:predicted nucleic acid-binding Zn ribbon protein
VTGTEGFEPLASSLEAVVRSLKGPQAQGLAGLFSGWDDAVGPSIAAHARPLVLDDGRLVVEVDEPGWATQLRYLEAELRERLGPYVAPSTITSIEVRVRRTERR